MIRRSTLLLAALVALVGSLTSAAPASAASDGVWDYYAIGIGGTYQTLVGEFGGDDSDDLFFYAPGPAADSLWLGRAGVRNGTYAFDKRAMSVGGTYTPIVGDFAGDDHDDIFWYGYASAPDTLWISNGNGTFTSKSFRVNGRFRPYRLRNYNAGADDLLWYDPTVSRSYRWDFAADGSGTFTSLPQILASGEQVVVGDWNGDGQEDYFIVGQVDRAVYVFDDPTQKLERGFYIENGYLPVVVYAVPRDGILWFGPGSHGDAYWQGWKTNGFRSLPLRDLDLTGRVTTYPLQAALITGRKIDDTIFFDDGSTADYYVLLGHEKGDERPVVGDWDDDGLYDVLWYAAGDARDELWYAEPASGGAQPSVVTRAMAVPER